MTDEEEKVEEKEVVEDEQSTENEKEQEPKPMHTDIGKTTPDPVATVPRTQTPPAKTVSGIDVTARMDNDQKEVFKKLQAKAQAVPQHVGTSRPFCERMQAVRQRRRERKERRAMRG